MDPKTAAVLTTNRRSLSIPQMFTAIKANAQTIQKTVSELLGWAIVIINLKVLNGKQPIGIL